MAKLMTERLKDELAAELGVRDIVRREGWGAVPARECGRLVQQAVLLAERTLSARAGSRP